MNSLDESCMCNKRKKNIFDLIISCYYNCKKKKRMIISSFPICNVKLIIKNKKLDFSFIQ